MQKAKSKCFDGYIAPCNATNNSSTARSVFGGEAFVVCCWHKSIKTLNAFADLFNRSKYMKKMNLYKSSSRAQLWVQGVRACAAWAVSQGHQKSGNFLWLCALIQHEAPPKTTGTQAWGYVYLMPRVRDAAQFAPENAAMFPLAVEIMTSPSLSPFEECTPLLKCIRLGL